MAEACLAQRPRACVPRAQALSQKLLAVGAPPAAWAAVVVAGWAHAWVRAGQLLLLATLLKGLQRLQRRLCRRLCL